MHNTGEVPKVTTPKHSQNSSIPKELREGAAAGTAGRVACIKKRFQKQSQKRGKTARVLQVNGPPRSKVL
jgi:hypothetical protein